MSQHIKECLFWNVLSKVDFQYSIALSSIRSQGFATEKSNIYISLTSPVVLHCLFLFKSSYLNIKKQIIKFPTIHFILFLNQTLMKETILGFITVRYCRIGKSLHCFRHFPLKRHRRKALLIGTNATDTLKCREYLEGNGLALCLVKILGGCTSVLSYEQEHLQLPRVP